MKRPGQAMLETVLAVLIISFAFLVLFKLSYMLTGKVLLEHAAMRVARARTVGLNEFMCQKVARVAVIPVSGARLWPEGDELDWAMELKRVPIYLLTADAARANGVLDYEGWHRLGVKPGDGTDARVTLGFSLFGGETTFELDGRAGIERNASLYMMDQGR